MLRSWQDSLNEARISISDRSCHPVLPSPSVQVTPRLRLVRISGNSTLDKEIGKCRGLLLISSALLVA